MKIKIVILTLFVFILCGCEAVYNLDITEGYHESITIIPSNDSEKSQINNYYPDLYYAVYNSADDEPESGPLEGVKYYNKRIDTNNNLIFDYKFNDTFADSRGANYCYPSFVYIKGKYVRLNTLGDNDCFDEHPLLDKITVNIKVGESVHSHNADSVNGNVYTWVIEKGKARAINIEFDNPDYKEEDYKIVIPDNDDKDDDNKKESEDTKEKTNNGENDNLYLLLLTGLFFIILFVIIFFRNKFKK